MGNRFIKGKLHMNFKHKWIIPLLLLITIGLVGCSGKQGKEATNAQQDKQVLSGVYKTDDKYTKRDDGTLQPDYWYFKKNGKLLYCTPQVNSTNQNSDTDFWYGDASRGTWKSLGNDEFEIKMHDVYDNDYYTIKAKLNGNKLYTYSNSKNAKYSWNADTNTKQSSMTYSDFMDMFNKAKDSDQKGIQEDGYAKPDNDSPSSDSSDEANVNHKQIAVMLYQLCYPDDDISKEPEMSIFSYNGRQLIGNGGSVSIVRYSINGDTVTYAKKSQGSYGDDQTISVKELAKKYYSTSDQKSLVDKVASSLSTDN